MCECGCAEYVKHQSGGKQVVFDRAVEIVRKLGITAENLHLFEDGEYICGLLSPKIPPANDAAEVWDVVQTMHRLHERIHREEHQKGLAAAKDVFSKLPAKGPTRETMTLYHQLEQLQRELNDSDLDSLVSDPPLRATFHALRHVHDRSRERRAELSQQYNL